MISFIPVTAILNNKFNRLCTGKIDLYMDRFRIRRHIRRLELDPAIHHDEKTHAPLARTDFSIDADIRFKCNSLPVQIERCNGRCVSTNTMRKLASPNRQ